MTNSTVRRCKKKISAAEGYLMLEMPDHALSELNGSDFSQEMTFDVSRLQGDAFRMKKEYHTALKFYHQAALESSDNVSLLLGMAWCLKRVDKLAEAIDKTMQAYQVSPEEPIILYNLSCYHALAEDKASSLRYLARALRMDNDLLKLIPQETDFDYLRDDEDFLYLIKTAGTQV